jgi:hypothetical protein
MRKIPLRLAIAALCFGLGVFVAEIYGLYSLPEAMLPEEPPPAYQSSESPCFPGLSISVTEAPAEAIFGGVNLSPNAGSDRYILEWYSEALKDLGEVTLASSSSDDESYRFLWLRSFHDAIAIRVRRLGSDHLVIVRELERTGPRKLDPTSFTSTAFLLSDEEWNQFTSHLEHACFWQMPAPTDKIMCDGAQWIMEGYREGRYHIVDRQSPDEGAYRDACLYLLKVSHELERIPLGEVF